MSAENAYQFITSVYAPKPETPQWLVWLVVAGAVALIIGMEALRKHIVYTTIRDAICRVFAGESLEDVNIAFKGVRPEDLCQPLHRAMKRHAGPGQKLRNARLSVSLHNPLLLLVGVADVDVGCDFTVDGAELHEDVRLTVEYHQGRGIITPLCVCGVEEYVPPPADDEE